uniref:CCHC-type domain-containing protein n=1 Tax=viral metagenome TaxID=1070528 RepID=A0A6C0AEH6_9ZZZZ
MTNLIYALELENNKWYIGKTCDIESRINEHNIGSNKWIKTYKIKNHEIIENPVKSKFSEDNFTKEYMMKYGIGNVRGGSYTKFDLNKDEIKFLNKEFLHAEDKCFNCGDMNHYSSECPNKTEKLESESSSDEGSNLDSEDLDSEDDETEDLDSENLDTEDDETEYSESEDED